jgi:transcriptional regulator with XRE-family HTH domain
MDLKIREWRKARGMKQEVLASLIGRSVQALSAIERGKARPREATLKAIAVALGLSSTDDLYQPPEAWCAIREAEDLRRAARIIDGVAQIVADRCEDLPMLLKALQEIAAPSHMSQTSGN